jgi:hypothetical protein
MEYIFLTVMHSRDVIVRDISKLIIERLNEGRETERGGGGEGVRRKEC